MPWPIACHVGMEWLPLSSLFFFPVPLLFILLPPSTLPVSCLPLLTPILQIKPRATPTNDANGADVSRCRIRWGHGHVRRPPSTFPCAW